ncbi:MAG TPA: hypothetical protein VGO93_02835, partial [Candidatus Xenobia bacterium]
GQVVISRRLEDGQIAASVFFLDVWCIGVKTAFLAVVSSRRFRDMLKTPDNSLKEVDAPCARKLVEEAIRYAGTLGIEPPSDYSLAAKVLGDIDPMRCRQTFRFGKSGKPCFVPGPACSPERTRKIVEALTKHCGLGGFEFTS